MIEDHLLDIPEPLRSEVESLLWLEGELAKNEPALEASQVFSFSAEGWMNADSMQSHWSTSDVQDSNVLDGRILDDLNRASRQGFDLFDCSFDAAS
jgi:hypothetical protein